MIRKFTDAFISSQQALKEKYLKELPETYEDIVKDVLLLSAADDVQLDKLTVIDHGDYQGTQLFIVPKNEYQPSTYYYIFVDYGSCSGCDTLEKISGWRNEPITEQQAADHVMLALHIVQSIKRIGASDDTTTAV